MFNYPMILVSGIFRAALYLCAILFLIAINSGYSAFTPLLFNFISIVAQLLLLLVFEFLITILKKVNERRSIIIGFLIYAIAILLAMANSLVFHSSPTSLPAIIMGALSIIATINLFVQGFRIRRSHISIYYRVLVTNIFTILIIKIFAPLIAVIFIYPSNRIKQADLMNMTALLNQCLSIGIPIIIFLMIRRLKNITAA